MSTPKISSSKPATAFPTKPRRSPQRNADRIRAPVAALAAPLDERDQIPFGMRPTDLTPLDRNAQVRLVAIRTGTPSKVSPSRVARTAGVPSGPQFLATLKDIHRTVTATHSQRLSPACFQPFPSTLACVTASTRAHTSSYGAS